MRALQLLYSAGSGEKYQVSMVWRPSSTISTFLTLVNSSCSRSALASNSPWCSSASSSSRRFLDLRSRYSAHVTICHLHTKRSHACYTGVGRPPQNTLLFRHACQVANNALHNSCTTAGRLLLGRMFQKHNICSS